MSIQLSPELAAKAAEAEHQSRVLFEAERENIWANLPAPVSVDCEYDVTITGTSANGEGIAKINGLVVFVPYTKPGWQGKVKVTKLVRRAAIATKQVETMPFPEKGKEYEVTIVDCGHDGAGIAKINGVITFINGAPKDWSGKVKVTGIGKSGRVVFAERTDVPASPKSKPRIYGVFTRGESVKKRDVSREKTKAYKPKRTVERRARLLNQALTLDNQFCAVCKTQTVAMKDINGNTVTTKDELITARELGPVTRVKIPHEGAHSPILGIPVPPAPKSTTRTTKTHTPKPKVQHKKAEPYKQLPMYLITEPSFAIREGYFDTRNNKTTDFPPSFLPYGDDAVLTTVANRPGSKISDIVEATGLSVAEVQAELAALSHKLDVTRNGRYFIRGQKDIRAPRKYGLPTTPAKDKEVLTENLINVATFKLGKQLLSGKAYSMFMDSIVHQNALSTFIAQDSDAQKRTLAELGFSPFAEGYNTDELQLLPVVEGNEENPRYYYPVGGNKHDGCLMKGTKNCFHLRVITTNNKLPQTRASMIDDYGFYKQAYVPVRENDVIHYIDGEFRNGKATITSYNAYVFTDFKNGKLIATKDNQCNPATAINNLVRLQAIKGMTTPYMPHKGTYYADIWSPRHAQPVVVEGGLQASPGSAGHN
ncbi:MAG: TRAM domain-containing protein [Nitrososphaerota archaeon]|nr:TRAM domain-containing protein [Ferrimicrobium acidiphilum]MDG6933255.1 TRAM domain-containing protein [Nitrososphaerota archaeon]